MKNNKKKNKIKKFINQGNKIIQKKKNWKFKFKNMLIYFCF